MRSAPHALLAVTAVAPAIAGIFCRLAAYPEARHSRVSLAQSMADLRSPLAILFALLLFFQFANEWSIAGWLPVFLIDRLGLSPATAVMLLALYWVALMAGRIVASRLLRARPPWKTAGISAFCALFGCSALLAAGSRFGVIGGLSADRAGFSAIYPLASERIASRFCLLPSGLFQRHLHVRADGRNSGAVPAGALAARLGLQVIPLAAMVGSCAVFALVLLIWLGRKVSGLSRASIIPVDACYPCVVQ